MSWEAREEVWQGRDVSRIDSNTEADQSRPSGFVPPAKSTAVVMTSDNTWSEVRTGRGDGLGEASGGGYGALAGVGGG